RSARSAGPPCAPRWCSASTAFPCIRRNSRRTFPFRLRRPSSTTCRSPRSCARTTSSRSANSFASTSSACTATSTNTPTCRGSPRRSSPWTPDGARTVPDRASATPLLALDAVVLDTETTSLDPARARLVEIGAYRLTAGRIDPARRFHSMVHPGEPVSPASTRIHGIDDAKLVGAPDFPAAWAAFRDYLHDCVVVGHTIEYDIAVFAAECKRAGIDFRPPRFIDVRWLAEMI